MRRDLFADDGGGTCLDKALIDRLVRDRLDAAAAAVKAEGWLWTEARPAFGWEERQAFGEAEPDYGDPREEDEDGEPVPFWPDAVKAMAGAVVTLGYDGTAQIERGLIRTEDMPDGIDEGEAGNEEDGQLEGKSDGQAGGRATALPAALIEDLTAHRSAALRAELAQSPAQALALVVYALAAPLFCRGASGGVLDLQMRRRRLAPSMKQPDAPAMTDLDAARARIADRLPADETALWEWCLSASQSDLLDVLAVAAAHGLDAVATKANPNRRGVMQGDALGHALGLDMAQWYRPTAAGYFERVPKAVILSDLEEARQAPCAPAWHKLPKKELAALAERETADIGWLPAPLR